MQGTGITLSHPQMAHELAFTTYLARSSRTDLVFPDDYAGADSTPESPTHRLTANRSPVGQDKILAESLWLTPHYCPPLNLIPVSLSRSSFISSLEGQTTSPNVPSLLTA